MPTGHWEVPGLALTSRFGCSSLSSSNAKGRRLSDHLASWPCVWMQRAALRLSRKGGSLSLPPWGPHGGDTGNPVLFPEVESDFAWQGEGGDGAKAAPCRILQECL